MDLLSPIFTHAVATAALTVVVIQQVLKLKVIPLAFANRYPVPTLIVLSVVASIITVVQTTLAPHTLVDWAVLAATIAVTAALTYRTTIANWQQLRDLEG